MVKTFLNLTKNINFVPKFKKYNIGPPYKSKLGLVACIYPHPKYINFV